jgi:Arylsulfotransferase (ASST)
LRRLRFLGLVGLPVVLLALGLTACVPVPPSQPLIVSATPALFPAFETGVVDYVNRCDPATPTEVQVTAPDGTTVSVDGAAPQSGTFTVEVAQDVGKRFTIDVTTGGTTTNHHVRCLPTDFPNWSVEKTGTPQAEFYATVMIQGLMPNYSAIFDTNGVPVWWLDRQPTFLLAPLPNRNFAIIKAGMEEYDLNGNLVRTLNTVGGPLDNHDVILLPNGNYVMATVQQQPCDLTSWGAGLGPLETCVNHVFQELTPLGVVVGAWDTSLHIPVTETTPPWRDNHDTVPPDVYDPWHYNSVEFTGDGFIISFRHLDAVYKIDSLTPTGSIVWKLGGIPRPESLTLVDDPLGGATGQHDARWLGDGTVTIHDNGTNALGLGSNRQPRSVRYAVDTGAMTATLVEEVYDADVGSSPCCGSTRRLPGGNWVTGWGGSGQSSEYAPDSTRVFRLLAGFVYRGIPLLPGQFTADEFRAGMDAQYAS